MKGVPPWLVRWARRTGTRDVCPALAALVGRDQNIFSHRTLFHLICPHHSASWTGSRAASPNICLWYRKHQIFYDT
jgi:hypothetical protein